MGELHDRQDFDDYLVESVTIDEHAIQDEYCRVAADLAYWGRAHAEAEGAYILAKAKLKRAEAQAHVMVREMMASAGKKPTDKAVEANVELQPGVEKAHAEFAHAAVRRKETSAYMEAISTKRDMLISLGATQRKEMDGDPSIRE